MTARDEAIDAIWRTMDYLPRQEATAAVDAIPGDVLVRYAIERGALVSVQVGEDLTGLWAHDTDGGPDFNPDHETLYRVVTP